MGALTITEAMLMAPAAARKATFVRRIAHNAACAIGLTLITGSYLPLIVWYPLLVAMLAIDVEAGQRFLRAAADRTRGAGIAFVAMSVAAISTYAGMALTGALLGGADGRLAAVLMACGSLVTIMVLMVEAPGFMLLSAAPTALLIAVLPLLPDRTPDVDPIARTIGLYLVAAVFAHQLLRSVSHHVRLFRHEHEARQEAERRREEAEIRGREAEARRREAEVANQAKVEFLTMVTHELRTPLNAVINYAEIIEEDGEGVIAEDARRITKSARHLLGMIERILEFSEVRRGEVGLTSDVDLVALARRVLSSHSAALEHSGNVTAIVCSEPDAVVHTDAECLSQSLDAVISNAAKFTKDGRIEVIIGRDEECWRIVVTDTGIGMSEAQVSSLFEAFRQGDGAHTRSAEGLGLGLATAHAVMKMLGGSITVTSTPGKGTSVTLMIAPCH
jgi:signal transduction histidine kinase